LKIISLYSNETQLIKKSIKGDRQAQKVLYEKYAAKMFVVYDDDVFESQNPEHSVAEGLLDVEYVQQLIDGLPEGYKTVFLLYAIEGYGHQEIAKMLDISEGTSKSQLFKARKMLQENLRLNGMAPQQTGANKR
jgi:RNA polymerase sigma-70 factor (ECF subfamily)